MRALLIVLGIVILIGGLCVTIFSGFAPLFSVAADAFSAMTNMLGDTAALEERFCNAGERVVVNQPDRGFTATSPDNVEGLIFCEDSSGNRRDVSAEFFIRRVLQRLRLGSGTVHPRTPAKWRDLLCPESVGLRPAPARSGPHHRWYLHAWQQQQPSLSCDDGHWLCPTRPPTGSACIPGQQ